MKKVLTELDLRAELKKMGPLTELKVKPGTILTPAARSFLSEQKIKIITDNKEEVEEEKKQVSRVSAEENKGEEVAEKAKYLLLYSQTKTATKPEVFTHLQGNDLVPKYHPRIKLRGKIDSLEAYIIRIQVVANIEKQEKLLADLQDILDFVRNLMRAEVLGVPVKQNEILGYSANEIREMSHDPKKHLGVEHILPSYNMGKIMALLNHLRTQVRETEIVACEAFTDQWLGLSREDVVKALNRLSSAVYVMMCWWKAGKYEKQRLER